MPNDHTASAETAQRVESDYTPEKRRDAIQRTIDLLAAGKTRDEAAAEVRAALSLPSAPKVCPECRNTDPDACVRCISSPPGVK